MVGFTAINSQSLPPFPGQWPGLPLTPQSPPQRGRALASDYVGHGDAVTVLPTAAQACKPLHGSVAKKTRRGKKRATTSDEHSEPKRKKSNSIAQALKMTNSGDSSMSDNNVEVAGDTVSVPKCGFRPLLGTSLTSVAVHFQPQSTSKYQQPVVQTSIDAVRAGSGRGCTIYSNPSSSPSRTQLNADRAQPLHDATVDCKLEETSVKPYKPVPAAALSKAQANGANEVEIPDVTFLMTPTSSGPTLTTSTDVGQGRPSKLLRQSTNHSDDSLLSIDDSMAEELEEKAVEFDKALKAVDVAPARCWTNNIVRVSKHEDYGGLLMSTEQKAAFASAKRKANDVANPRPIVRRPFANPIFDRSPLFGLSSSTVLRTCFRVGEALSAGAKAARCNKPALLELYARVTASEREMPPSNQQRRQSVQHFDFRDLYHDNPPYLSGDFALWNQSKLWDIDSKAFLLADSISKGLMCRAVGKIKRDGTGWRLAILSIWQASWEDVNAVAGIYISK